MNRQSNCGGLCRRHSLSSPDVSSLQIVAVVSPQRDNTLSGVPPWQPEQGGRQRITSGLDLSRIELIDLEDPGPLCSGLVCHTPQPSVTQLETRPIC